MSKIDKDITNLLRISIVHKIHTTNHVNGARVLNEKARLNKTARHMH